MDAMEASAEEMDALANNIALAATYWLNFQNIFSAHRQGVESEDIGRGVYQVMAMVSPFLKGSARELLESLSHDYLTS